MQKVKITQKDFDEIYEIDNDNIILTEEPTPEVITKTKEDNTVEFTKEEIEIDDVLTETLNWNEEENNA